MAKRVKKVKKIKKENGITNSMILITIFSIALVLLLTLPNIYLDNQIYYKSRQIAHLQYIVRTLKEEQVIIERKLEEVKYREDILLGQE